MIGEQGDQPAVRDSREIRIFISSTFRDMMQERDLLVREVFPELRRKCARRFVTLTEVDLRWGITEEQAAEGQVLPLCLAEIERCRPYFIGLLGERYGWIPDTIKPELIEREPWLKEHVQNRTSVTELEILHGVLRNPQMKNQAFFYFRDPAYIDDFFVTEAERAELVERDIPGDVAKYGKVKAARLTEERKAKLASLKQRIRDSGLPLVDPYANPQALARIILRQFSALIEDLYPEEEAPDPLTREHLAHEAYAKDKLFACIERPEHLLALDAYASASEHHGKGLVLTGESGSGKTVLLADWAAKWTVKYPGGYLFQHFFGATPESASPKGFLRRLLGELKEQFKITENIPASLDKLRDTLPAWLARVSGKRSVVLVLDGLDQVQGSDAERRLNFIPRHFPPGVTVIASALPGPALETLVEQGWNKHELPCAGEEEIRDMLSLYLDIHSRNLAPSLVEQIVTSPGAGHPLYLRTLLEELRQFGDFEELPRRIVHYLEATNPGELFLRVIRRWQDDFESDGPQSELVRRALTHLWAARQGLSGAELLDMMGMDEANSSAENLDANGGPTPFPRASWTPLYLALEPHLSHKEGLYTFGHDFLRQAVEDAFLSNVPEQQAAHLAAAGYFEHHPSQRGMSPRKAAEWPYHLHAAAAWERLERCLTDFPLFLELYNDKTQWELTGYWIAIQKSNGRNAGECYAEAYTEWIGDPRNALDHVVPANLGLYLLENGYPTRPAEYMLRHALEIREKTLGPEHLGTLTSMSNLASLLYRKGEYDEAERLYRRVLETRERIPGPEHPDTLISMNNLAGLLQNKGEYDEAEPLYRRALESRERTLGSEHPDTLTSMSNLAGLLHRKGEYDEAERLFRQALEAEEKSLGPEHPDTLTSMNNLACLLQNKGEYDEAEPFFRRTLEARERILGPEHPGTLASMNNLAVLLESKGEYDEVKHLCRRAMEAQERILGPEHPDTLTSMNNLACLLHSKGEYDEAEPLFRRTLEAREQILGPEHPDTLTSVSNLAGLLGSKGEYDEAEQLYRRASTGMLKISLRTRRLHPTFKNTIENYILCLGGMDQTPDQIRSTLENLMKHFDSLGSNGTK